MKKTPAVMYGCESWTVKKAEHRRIDAFELWCWRRLLRVPWTAKRFNQSLLKEISPEISLEGMMLKLKLQYFDHLWLPSVHCHEPLLIVLQAVCLSDLVPWIYFSLPLHNHKRFNLGHTWMVWSSGFPYFLQSMSEFGYKEFMIWATVSSWSCFC